MTADFDGNFSLNTTDENATLVISYIGFSTKEVEVNGQSTINISLEEGAQGLDEVVVVGYGTQKRKDITGSVASVSTEDIADIPMTNIDDGLVGRILGWTLFHQEVAPALPINCNSEGSDHLPLPMTP